jgi:hypothetical protein
MLGLFFAAPSGAAPLGSTFLFVVRNESTTSPDRPTQSFLTPNDANFAPLTDLATGAFTVTVTGTSPSRSWSLRFVPPLGQPLAPGRYVRYQLAPQPPDSFLFEATNGSALVCPEGADEDVQIRDVRFSPSGAVVAFAADFTVACLDHGVDGSLRVDTGDVACAAAPDGTACDLLNACAPEATCQGGTCVAAAPLVCPSAGECAQQPLCDPVRGECVPTVPLPDGSGCLVRPLCEAGTCQNGVCLTKPTSCSDANFCTIDACDTERGECTHQARGGGCWTLTGRPVVTATALGRTCACRLARSSTALVLADDGSYATPGGSIPCSLSTRSLPDEIGTARPLHRGRQQLEAANLDALTSTVRECTGLDFRTRRYATTFRLDPDGRGVHGTHTERLRVVVGRVPLTVGVRVRFQGTRGTTAPDVQSGFASTLERCQQRLTTCFERP